MLFENGSADPGWFPRNVPAIVETQAAASSRPDGSRYGTDNLRIDPELYRRWIQLGRQYPPEDVIYRREQARNGRLTEWFAYGDEIQRFGFTTEMSTLREDMEGANFRFLLPRAADEDGVEQLSKEDLNLAHIAKDYAEDIFLDHLPEFFSSVIVDSEYLGIGGAAPHLEPRGYKGKWSSFEEIEQVPSRNFEFYRPTDSFRVYASWQENRIYQVADLAKRNSLVFIEQDKARPLDQKGMLWKLSAEWAFATYVMEYWMETVQDHGKPIFHASYPQGNKTAEKIAQDVINQLAFDLRVAHPDSVLLEMLESKTEGRGNQGGVHQQALEYLKRDFGAIILGHTHASGAQVGTGSRTSAEKADKNTIQRENGILRRGGRVVTKQLVMPRMVEAFGAEKARLICPRFSAEVSQTPDYESESRVILNLSQAGLRVNQEQQAERVGYELADNAEGIQVPAMAAAIAAKSEATLARPRVVPSLPEKANGGTP